MRDSIGGVVVLVIIVVFIVFASGYMAFNVNYTKAFNMKNKIISSFEEYKGNCSSTTSDCAKKIQTYASDIGYHPKLIKCDDGFNNYEDLYCYKDNVVVNGGGEEGNIEKHYYRIVTRIDIQIPIIENIFGLRILNVSGDTGQFVKE